MNSTESFRKSYLIVKDYFEQNKLKPLKITSKAQLADILTKLLTGDQFQVSGLIITTSSTV